MLAPSVRFPSHYFEDIALRTFLSKIVPIAVVAATLVALVPAAEVEAVTDYLGPTGWSKADVPSPTPTRTITQWHIAGDTTTSVTFIEDSTQSFSDSMAAMTKNFTDNHIKPVQKDLPCRGTTAHMVEFKAGPDGSQTIINRMIVTQGTGIASITYTRADGNPFDTDVQKSETAYCAAT